MYFYLRLHCISSIQTSSIGAEGMIGFSARHDKCFPASSLVAIKDKTLVVVLPSFVVCNGIRSYIYIFASVDQNFISFHIYSLYSFFFCFAFSNIFHKDLSLLLQLKMAYNFFSTGFIYISSQFDVICKMIKG